MAHVQERDEEMITGINVTPLVDVALVLLVILMVTATYIVGQTIPMDLPKAATGESLATTLSIAVDQSGATFLDGKPVAIAELRARVRAAKRGSGGARAVIAADGGARHRFVVRVIDLLRQEGITQFAINVQPGELGQDG